MRHFTQSVVVIFVSLTAFPAAATPPDALINNTLSLPFYSSVFSVFVRSKSIL